MTSIVEGSTKKGPMHSHPKSAERITVLLTERNSRVDADFESNEFMRLR